MQKSHIDPILNSSPLGEKKQLFFNIHVNISNDKIYLLTIIRKNMQFQ